MTSILKKKENNFHTCMYLRRRYYYIIGLRNLQPSVSRARPPVGWHRTAWQPGHWTTVWEWENTVAILLHDGLGHLTFVKLLLGCWTSLFNLCLARSSSADGYSKSLGRGILGKSVVETLNIVEIIWFLNSLHSCRNVGKACSLAELELALLSREKCVKKCAGPLASFLE